MPDPAGTTHALPTAEQVSEYLEAYPPRGPSRMASWLPLLALMMVLVFAMSSTSVWAALLPWMALGGFFLLMATRVRRMRMLERSVVDVQELAMLRQFREAFENAWRLLPKLIGVPELHGRIVAFLAHLLDQLRAYEGAIVGYDFLVSRMPGEHPGAVQLRLHRVVAQLACDRLADADDGLRKLRGVDQQTGQSTSKAMYHLARLIQSVRTHHYDDAVAMNGSLIEVLRPLGVEAGYGQALMALSYHEMAERAAIREAQSGETVQSVDGAEGGSEGREADDSTKRDALRARALACWSRATLLLPVDDLTGRFGELSPLSRVPAFAEAAREATPPT